MEILGKILIHGKEREILLKEEDGLYKYYFLDLIGVYTPKIPGQTIIFREDTVENRQKDQINDNEIKISSAEKQQIEHFLEKIRINEVIEKITLKTTNKKQDRNKQKKTEIIPKSKMPKKATTTVKDINIKQEVDMDSRVTDMSNLQQILQKNDKMPKLEHGDEPLKMGIVESDELDNLKNEKGQKEQGHTSRYEAVMVTKKGKVKALDLENDTQEGTNPLEKNYQIKQNDIVQKGDVLTRLKVGEGTIGIEKGQYGEIEVYHSPRKTIGGKNIEGNKSLDRQLETSNAKNTLEGTDIETLKLAQEHNDGYRSVEEGYQEVDEHKEKHKDCEPKGAEDLDGDRNTVSHVHEHNEFLELSTGEKVTYSNLASKWGFFKDGKPNEDFIKEKISKKENENKSIDEIIKELDEEYEDPRAPERGI